MKSFTIIAKSKKGEDLIKETNIKLNRFQRMFVTLSKAENPTRITYLFSSAIKDHIDHIDYEQYLKSNEKFKDLVEGEDYVLERQ